MAVVPPDITEPLPEPEEPDPPPEEVTEEEQAYIPTIGEEGIDEALLPQLAPHRATAILYEQQNPIYQVIFPITPTELPETGQVDAKSYRIIGKGGHSFPDGRAETQWTLAGYFPGGPRFDAGLPHIHDWRPPQDLADQIRGWLDGRARLRYRVGGRAGVADVPCYVNKYTFTRTGHAGDIKYEVGLTEWRSIRVMVDGGTDASQQLDENGNTPTESDQQDEPNPIDYTVVPGDTLWDLSKRFLGDAGRWPELYEANKDVIGSDPHWIYPGQVFQIPGGTVGTEADDGYASAGGDATDATLLATDWSEYVVGAQPVPRTDGGFWRPGTPVY